MTNVDSQRIREIRDNTKAMAEAFSSIANTLADAFELFKATQTETQNSNLTFEKDECAKEYEELGLKELKELIKADRKTEPQTNADQHVQHVESVETMSCEECKHWIFTSQWGWFCPLKGQDECHYEPIEDEPQTDCSWK